MVFRDVLRQPGEEVGRVFEPVVIHPPAGRFQFGGEVAHPGVHEHELLLVVADDVAARFRFHDQHDAVRPVRREQGGVFG